MKDKNLVEKYDDNPGTYFGMLVEGFDSTYASVMKQADSDAQKLRDSWEKDDKSLFDTLSELGYESDYEDSPYMFKDADDGNTIVFDFRPINSFEDYVTYFVVDKDNRIPDGWTKTKLMIDFWKDKNESLKEGIDKQLVQKLYSMWFSKEQAEWLAKNAKDYAESLAYGHTTTDDLIEAEEYVNSKMKKQEAIKEDKFIPQDKMSKKDRRELDSQKRNTWGNTNPVTKVQPNKKAYDRKRDKKANLDESVRDFEWDRKLWCVVNDNGSFAGSPCLSWEEARELSVNHDGSRIYEMTLDKDQIHNDEEDLSAYGMEYGYYN